MKQYFFLIKWVFFIEWRFPIDGEPQQTYNTLLFIFTLHTITLYAYMYVGRSPQTLPSQPGN